MLIALCFSHNRSRKRDLGIRIFMELNKAFNANKKNIAKSKYANIF